MTVWQNVLIAAVLVCMITWLVWQRRRDASTPAPLPPLALAAPFDADAATEFASARVRRCDRLADEELRAMLRWCADYVARNATPMNGNSGYDGWFAPPNVFDVLSHLRRQAEAAGLDVDPACVLEVANLYDDFVRHGQPGR